MRTCVDLYLTFSRPGFLYSSRPLGGVEFVTVSEQITLAHAPCEIDALRDGQKMSAVTKGGIVLKNVTLFCFSYKHCGKSLCLAD